MTRRQAQRIYAMIADNFDDAPVEITQEMTAVVSARSDRAAGDVIRWWDCWPNDRHKTATATARFIRRRAKEAKP